MNKIAVIIPMFGKEELTRKCIEFTLKNAGVPVDIVVVDDGSPIPYEDERATIIRLEQNRGYTGATNEGILHAQKLEYDYVHLLNNDTEPEPNFIKVLHDVMQKESAIGIAGSVRKLVTDSEMCYELFGEDMIRGYQRVCNQDMLKDLPEIIHTYWVPLCSSLVRMDMIREIGLLDKQMRTWCSDTDYCFRANFAHWNVSIIPASIVLHIHQGTTGTNISEGVSKDQQVALQKISGFHYANLMTKMPLDCESKSYGKISFEVIK